ncbi:ubiquitin-conjugating enzyme E2 4 [Cordyceps fumosorosea ARSEF 2679]|uniref:Ubiquitin-conjugating enzyme E2 4 n=1 Tax=Cordyceps fumosorosea (strain ARSEF 2679) TaxID=1081104 RepID=A0A168DXH5_CORFA|nr:ubiquitin-conjugating enzyme E2 4 [Cordyceps fumosorosea ARSEF 2679]OAA73125.1 ubiquitin-conjugating enzyme E2 4 [Cordyceps fumosorosea ARSEF 2679]
MSSRKEKSSTGSNKKESSGRTGARRLLKELETWRAEQPSELGIERLGPVSDENLMRWEAVINGRGVGHGYDGAFSPRPPSLTPKLTNDTRRPLAPLHRHPRRVPAEAAADALRDAGGAPERGAARRRDLPGPAQGGVDADVQRAGVRAGGAHAAELPGDGLAAQRGRGGAAAWW